MYIFDTDHLSVLERGGTNAERLRKRLESIDSTQISVSIISYEEQMRGWLSYVNKVKNIEQQVEAYKRLKQQLKNYCMIPILEFDQQAAQEFQRLKKAYRQLGSMDLKIASVALVNKAVLLTRNSADFEKISGLSIEDWT
ncbi:MAG: type II toxin-antitoxin system VapC family toxin [Leptolyngbyaceae cyanobacterium SM1_1_3]|nr:type II toxin-antitoxin system VapC family toxin [Leptolyngbyaceae cyanobacterium SM1_1_3]NJM84778.1 type II toxin-antitoxin system VapC family toxin [Leptolyngbyaceae cyanobacterium RM2_2_21]NJN04454.1 type II toxin-antitoxin system VapC family toxin [Leptolyngbyaceae cyanobacterium RM1_1_2]NJO10061.1 type II toxin-antitoxin system VapC family toxin [Leptolyngbyaceae cyanobacterium SL_1_1]